MKILDTVALIAFSRPSDRLHEAGKKHIKAVTNTDETFVPSAVLLELDTVLKSRNFSYDERKEIFETLAPVIPNDKVLRLTPPILKRAAELDSVASWRDHYFDVIIVATALEHAAEVVTTDSKMSSLGVTVSW